MARAEKKPKPQYQFKKGSLKWEEMGKIVEEFKKSGGSVEVGPGKYRKFEDIGEWIARVHPELVEEVK